MNPFELRGPEFLLFYVTLAAGLCVVAAVIRRLLESGEVPKLGEPDPFAIAYLRGGANEAMRVATLSLIDRGLLKPDGEKVVATAGAVLSARRPLEQAIIKEFPYAGRAASVFRAKGPREACRAIAAELRRRGLLVSGGQIIVRIFFGLGVQTALWAVAKVKLDIAAAAGRHNTGILQMSLWVMPMLVIFTLAPRTTPIGARVLKDLRELFAGLKVRAPIIRAGGGTNEHTLLAAVYGINALSGTAAAQSKALFPQGGNASSSCGSSCGSSSCGSSCGGGCGGAVGGAEARWKRVTASASAGATSSRRESCRT